MLKLSRAIFLLIVLMVISIPVLADELPRIQQDESDSAIVRVIPDEASVGSDHVILITGLENNEQIDVHIIFDATDVVVYQARENANERGIVEINIFTETGDEPGEYRIEVLNNSGDVIGTTELTVLEADIFEPEISIAPLEAEAGSVFTVEISNIRPFTVLEIIIEDESGTEVFSQRSRATVDGEAVINYTSDITNSGILSVRLIENETTVIYEADITVLEQAFPATAVIEPETALPGDTVFVTLSGLEAEASVVIDVLFEDVVIDTIEETANVSGLVIFPYTFADDAILGRYQFRVFQDDEQVGFERYLLEIPPVTVDISPPVGTAGSVFAVTVSDLRASESITVDLMSGDEIIQSRTATADADGIARALLGQRIDLEIGIYGVHVYRAGQDVHTQTIEVAEERPQTTSGINPDDVVLSINPESGVVPTTYTITVEGVPADTDLTLFILFEGQSILSISGTADADGFYTTQISSESSDPPGVYTLEVRAAGGVIGSVDFEIAEETSDTDDDSDETVIGDAVISIDPATVVQGERVEIIVSNLAPEEAVTVDVLFEGDTIYSSERIADANGAIGLALRASDDDETGDYTVQVSRDGAVIATDSFEIVTDADEISFASISISPETAPQGSDFVMTVSGLDAGESTEVIVSLDGDVVYETEREANSDGSFTIVLSSDGSDETGTYDVLVVRDNNNELEATLTITEGDASVSDDEPVAEPDISIEPEDGDIGTQHTVTVTGLSPEADFILIISYDGDAVYEAAHTADEDGNFSTVIVAVEGDPTGEYTISIEHGGDDLSATLLVIGEEDEEVEVASELELNIESDEVEPQESFEIVVSGLEEGEEVIVEVVFDGEVVFETEREANDNGEVELILSSDEGDPGGVYTIVVRRGDEVISGEVLVFVESDPVETEVVITVEPESAHVGSEYQFNISGLGSNEEFDIMVSYDNEIVYETTRTSDASGFFTMRLETGDNDDPGTYTFSVLRDGEILGSVEFEVEEDERIIDSTIMDDEESDSGAEVGGNDDDVIVSSYVDDVNLDFDGDNSVEIIEFEGEAGDVISVRVVGEDGIDTVATLFSPSGEEIAGDDDGGSGFDPEIERVVLPETGTYSLEIRTYLEGDSGSVIVTVSRDDIRTISGDEARIVRLDSKTMSDILTYEAEAGETVSLIIELDSGSVGSLTISAEQNDVRLMTYETSGLPGVVIVGFVVPEDGNVVISFRHDGTGSAILDVSVESE